MANGDILTGSKRIVLETLMEERKRGHHPSFTDLADLTFYDEKTVASAVRALHNNGFIRAIRPGRGHRYSYEILAVPESLIP